MVVEPITESSEFDSSSYRNQGIASSEDLQRSWTATAMRMVHLTPDPAQDRDRATFPRPRQPVQPRSPARSRDGCVVCRSSAAGGLKIHQHQGTSGQSHGWIPSVSDTQPTSARQVSGVPALGSSRSLSALGSASSMKRLRLRSTRSIPATSSAGIVTVTRSARGPEDAIANAGVLGIM